VPPGRRDTVLPQLQGTAGLCCVGVEVGGGGGCGVFVGGPGVLVGLGPGVEVGAVTSHSKCHVSLGGLTAPTTSPPWPWTTTTRQ